MAEVGRTAATDPSVAAVIAELAAGPFYERFLALRSCYGSRNGSLVLRALSDPSRIIQKGALKLIPLSCTDTEVARALSTVRPKLHLPLLRGLRRRGRLAPVDGFLDELARTDPAAVSVLLPLGSAAVVNRHRSIGRQLGGWLFWGRLAAAHLELAVTWLEKLISDVDEMDARLAYEANTVLTVLAGRHPDHALTLARKILEHRPPSFIAPALNSIGRFRPAEVADILLASEDQVGVNLTRSARRLDAPRLLALLERRPDALPLTPNWFKQLKPELRAAAFERCGSVWRDGDGCVAPPLVGLLPGPLRAVEARRHLELPTLAARPNQRLQYAAFVPWNEARTTLDPWLGHPEGTWRGLALQVLAGVARYERGRLADVLGLIKGRRHEQDPVRNLMLAGLARLPEGAWREEHLDDLDRVLRDALDAADLSAMTAGQAERLVVSLLPRFPERAVAWLVDLVRERGYVHIINLEDRLTPEDVRRVAPAIMPVLKTWRNRERQAQLARLAGSFGRRLPLMPELVELLESEVEVTRTQWAAEGVLGILARHCKRRLGDLVPRLVNKDPSWVTRPVVHNYLHRHRQDLLTPFLGQQAYKGRFSTGRTRVALPFRNGFFRWTPGQQETFQSVLLEVVSAGGEPRDTPSILFTISQLAALPAVDAAPLGGLAGDSRRAVQEAALRALGKLDAGQGVSKLVEALSDERARVAVYALRSAVLGMPSGPALALLRNVPLDKVTVAKECVRLLGEIPGDDAFPELMRIDALSLHRDVRTALLRALWGHLERPEARAVLDREAATADAATMNSIVRIPADRLSEPAQRWLVALLTRLLNHAEPLVRLQTLRRCVSLPVADPDCVLLPRLVQSLRRPSGDERETAALAAIAACRADDGPVLASSVAGILNDRRALATTVTALRNATGGDRRRLGAVSRAVLDALRVDPLTAGLRVQLEAVALSWQEWAVALRRAAESGELNADVLTTAIVALNGWYTRTDRADLAHLEAALAGDSDDRCRRLALAALVVQARLPGGWNEERLGRLETYRADRSPLVAAAAQFTFPAGNEVAGDDTAGEWDDPD
jgi:hypothetical protein